MSKYILLDNSKVSELVHNASTPFEEALANYIKNPHSVRKEDELIEQLTTCYGKPLHEVSTVEEFFNKKLLVVLNRLVGADMTEDIKILVKLLSGCQFSSSENRRSYRTNNFGFHIMRLIRTMSFYIQIQYDNKSIEEMIFLNCELVFDFNKAVALEIYKGNKQLITSIKQMLLGESLNSVIQRDIIVAIVISGQEELIALLKKILIEAGLQEGLRQAVLESADSGNVNTFIEFYSLCIEHDLFRYSSGVRAFEVWTGLYSAERDTDRTRQLAQTGYDCLTNKQKWQEAFESTDPYSVYLSLWAMGNMDIHITNSIALDLVNHNKKYMKLMGWHFISQIENISFRHQLACAHLSERDDHILERIVPNLYCNVEAIRIYTFEMKDKDWSVKANPDVYLSASREERYALFIKLKELALHIRNRTPQLAYTPFPFYSPSLTNESVIYCMLGLAIYDLDIEMIDELYTLLEFFSDDQKRAYFIKLIDPNKHEKHRYYIFELLKSRSQINKEIAIEKLKLCKANEEDVKQVCSVLSGKAASVRQKAMSYLVEQSNELRQFAVNQLIQGNENQLQAVIELLIVDQTLATNNNAILETIKAKKLSTQTEMMLKQITGLQNSTISQENIRLELNEAQANNDTSIGIESNYAEIDGFGLFDKRLLDSMVERFKDEQGMHSMHANVALFDDLYASALEKINNQKLLAIEEIITLFPKEDEFKALLQRINAVIEKYSDFEVEIEHEYGRFAAYYFNYKNQKDYYGGKFHNRAYIQTLDKENPSLLLFWQDCRVAVEEYLKSPAKHMILLLQMRLLGYKRSEDDDYAPWMKQLYHLDLAQYAKETYGKRLETMLGILKWAYYESFDNDSNAYGQAAYVIFKSFMSTIGEKGINAIFPVKDDNDIDNNSDTAIPYFFRREKGLIEGAIVFMKDEIFKNIEFTDSIFKRWFPLMYALDYSRRLEINFFSFTDLLRAYDMKLVAEDSIYHWVLHPNHKTYGGVISYLTLSERSIHYSQIYIRYPWLKAITSKLTDRLVEMEIKRGQLATVLSDRCYQIKKIYGAEKFCKLLAALGAENFHRGYYYSDITTKNVVLSHLLKTCMPGPEDSPDQLRDLLKHTDISQKRLVEATMYAPQWAGFVEQITGWEGLKKAIWFFHAHISERFDAEKETEIAYYSPITPLQFNDGACDINWFREIYEGLGEKRFQVLYKSAKYITDGSNAHRRVQLYVDAILENFDSNQMEVEIKEKRNQEKLRAYGLIPLGEQRDKELLRRYEFIKAFEKESQTYGSQRRESEGKACHSALENLTFTSGLSDLNRLIWKMEGIKLEEIRPLFEKQNIGEHDVYLHIDIDGTARVIVEKNGKQLKSVPSSLNKHEYVSSLKQKAKEIKEQRQRSKQTLETCMINMSSFQVAELISLMHHPVVAPLIDQLVWISATGELGFLVIEAGQLALKDDKGNLLVIDEKTTLTIAHPYNLISCGRWADFMSYLYAKQIIQPFKQIFREYYPLTDEEREEKIISRRYSGYQVQPRKALGLFRSRGWTVHYGYGLQKVSYSDNIIVRMNALADWFSPADIEAPTLETVEFVGRRDGIPVELSTVNPILFSEIMRDLDLVVSVGYVGGVDAETSHSTIALRMAIAKELVSLLKLSNVQFSSHRANIEGSFGSYSVHLGSGVTHARTKGMVVIIPVHSQHRGRVFLPFADEDPKTAEIISKIVLLAEDSKIKDPTILSQIR